MNVIDDLTHRNSMFADNDFNAQLQIMPSMKTVIIGCVDPRVDPADIFGLKPGEAAVIRNVGGRINPATLQSMAIVRTVAVADGKEVGPGWNLIVLHHTDCGIAPCLLHAPALLAKNLGVETAELDKLAIADPYAAVAIDVAALKANTQLPGGFLVTGMVYDVDTGKVEVVVPPALLRSEA
ncbi:MAG: carbonic anhydrase [Janthinobacterium lividum]|uniref:carbonic anhydrase n=1 Tax=Pseudomonas sp. MWU16-30317 TaxID=2878095 RepID=UPI001CFAA047|nr:carbonic anhydrase [Pseudomonas sp. MWU16-30317]